MPMQPTPQLEAKIEEMVAAGDYSDPESVMDDALRLLEARARRLQHLRALLAVGEEHERRGEVVEYTPELRHQIRQSARRLALAGEQPSPNVCP